MRGKGGGGTHGDAAVSADDGDVDGGREGEIAEDLRDERPRANDVEGGHAEYPSAAGLRIVRGKAV